MSSNPTRKKDRKRADFKCQNSGWKEVREPGLSKTTGFGVWMVPGLMALE